MTEQESGSLPQEESGKETAEKPSTALLRDLEFQFPVPVAYVWGEELGGQLGGRCSRVR